MYKEHTWDFNKQDNDITISHVNKDTLWKDEAL